MSTTHLSQSHAITDSVAGRFRVERVNAVLDRGRLVRYAGYGYYPPEARRAAWLVTQGYQIESQTAATASRAVALVRGLIRKARQAAGERAAAAVWDDLCARQAEIARLARTPADLLRHAEGRRACWAAAKAGKAYGAAAEEWARRSVVRQAVAILVARQARREARKVADAARNPEAGRFARLAQERLLARTRAAVLCAAGYRTAANGHTDVVRFGEPGVGCDTGKDWNVYRGAYKGWAATISSHTYVVRETWLADVEARDLACVDGLLTLDARPVPGHGPELFEAIWVEQGRGTSLNGVRGYIARDPASGRAYHAATARAALDGLARKCGQKPARRQGTLDLDRLARRYGDLPVRLEDSEAVGNCESGTVSWCRAVGIDPYGTATVAQVVAGYKLRPRPEVISVLRRVMRTRHGRTPHVPPEAPESRLDRGGRVVFDAEGGFRVVEGEE